MALASQTTEAYQMLSKCCHFRFLGLDHSLNGSQVLKNTPGRIDCLHGRRLDRVPQVRFHVDIASLPHNLDLKYEVFQRRTHNLWDRMGL
jgi:hypothetical protein